LKAKSLSDRLHRKTSQELPVGLP